MKPIPFFNIEIAHHPGAVTPADHHDLEKIARGLLERKEDHFAQAPVEAAPGQIPVTVRQCGGNHPVEVLPETLRQVAAYTLYLVVKLYKPRRGIYLPAH